MAHYAAMGSIPPKRHTQHRRPKNAGPHGGVGTGTGGWLLRRAHG